MFEIRKFSLTLVSFCLLIDSRTSASSECHQCYLTTTKDQSNCTNIVKCHDKYTPCLTVETLKLNKDPTYIKDCGNCQQARIRNNPGNNGVFRCWECFHDKCNDAKLQPVKTQ